MTENSNEKILQALYKNSQIAIESIKGVIKETNDEKMREELNFQFEEYEKVSGKISALATDFNIEIKEPNPMKKAMLWTSIKANTFTDNSTSHIDELMLKGTVMGVTELTKIKNDYKNDLALDERIIELVNGFVSMEELFEKRLKKFL